jgi:hypothetical protein
LGLLQQNPSTGYQLSKLSGVPRSRIYETLERLVAKGYAVALDTDAQMALFLEENGGNGCLADLMSLSSKDFVIWG